MNALYDVGYGSQVGWQTNYYAGNNYQIVASRQGDPSIAPQLKDSRDATTALSGWFLRQGCRTVADVCAGKGKMLKKFMDVGMRVAAIELNEKRSLECAKRLKAIQ
jgi:hypothetical protein